VAHKYCSFHIFDVNDFKWLTSDHFQQSNIFFEIFVFIIFLNRLGYTICVLMCVNRVSERVCVYNVMRYT
jgi:hypothetical protein